MTTKLPKMFEVTHSYYNICTYLAEIMLQDYDFQDF